MNVDVVKTLDATSSEAREENLEAWGVLIVSAKYEFGNHDSIKEKLYSIENSTKAFTQRRM